MHKLNESFHKIGQTGDSRIVRDKIAQLHELIQKWNKQVQTGSLFLLTIEKYDLGEDEDCNTKLYKMLEKLQLCVDKMENISLNMKTVCHNLKAVTKLQTNDNIALFKTWSAKEFEEHCEKISKAYEEELFVKQWIIESIAYTENATQRIALQAAWIFEPNIEFDIADILKALLLETEL